MRKKEEEFTRARERESITCDKMGTVFLATNSEFATAKAFGSNSPKNKVTTVNTAVITPVLDKVNFY
jgi:hypothetical protein